MDNGSILITYASLSGSTAETAKCIGQVFTDHKQQVDVLAIKDVTDVKLYRAFIIGSPIHSSKLLPEVIHFAENNREFIRQKPSAAFLLCITLGMAKAESYRPFVEKMMDPIRSLINPLSVGLFAGSLDFKKLPFSFDTLMLRLAVALGALPQGDHRDWSQIKAWAEALSLMIK